MGAVLNARSAEAQAGLDLRINVSREASGERTGKRESAKQPHVSKNRSVITKR
jgi:hypothetical protein